MSEWRYSDPPTGQTVEYEREDGVVEKGMLRSCGQSGTGSSLRSLVLHNIYMCDGGASHFVVKRWRETE